VRLSVRTYLCTVLCITVVHCDICTQHIERKPPTVIEHSLQPSVCLHVCSVHCDKMADRIRMQFGMVGRMGLWIGPRERVILGVNVGRSIVTNGEFDAACSHNTLGSFVAVNCWFRFALC